MKISDYAPHCNDDGAQCSCCFLQITKPAFSETIEHLQVVEGITYPCEIVQIRIDDNAPLQATADCYGVFHIENPYALVEGTHTIWVHSCLDRCCAYSCFCIKPIPPVPVPVPTIETPECGSTIADPSPWIFGRGVAGNTVQICIDGYGCQSEVVDPYGEYRIGFDIQFPDGIYTITATQIDPSGQKSQPVSCSFTIDTSHFLAEPIDTHMGTAFRTVTIDVLMSGSTGNATVYYLLLPPGTSAPSAEEVMNYQNATALLDGIAAAGQFVTSVTSTPTTYTWALTGLDKSDAPEGTTGIVDGYRYDVYIYAVSGPYNSGVLTFDNDAVLGMPFASGLGTTAQPFTIRELTSGELQKYPDLLADHPLNQPGVDENARQLENIERLVTLYEETSGYYGLADSMTLNYLMASDMDLSAYAAAYDGTGWESIGDIDGWINERKKNEHLFSGVFDGGDHTIANLSITPKATDDYFVGYRGLFGGVEDGTIKNLGLTDVSINAFTTAPGFAHLGSLIATSRNPTLTNLRLTNAAITADCGTVSTGDTHQINIGGFIGAIFEGASVNGITGQSLSIAVPSAHALALGGFVGYTDKFTSYDSYENISLSAVSISGYALIGGFAGYLVYGINLVKNVTINHVVITAPGGQAGGLIGLNYIFDSGGHELIEDCTVQNISVSVNGAGDPGDCVGGMIGMITRNAFPNPTTGLPIITNRVFNRQEDIPLPVIASPITTILRCSVTSGQINCAGSSGGLVGYLYISNDTEENRITLCKTSLLMNGTASNIGGLVGDCQHLTISQCFSKGTVHAAGDQAGGLVGRSVYSTIQDSYSTGTVTDTATGGGIACGITGVTILRSYRAGDVTSSNIAAGIAGALAISTIQNNFVLNGAMQASTAHRILGDGTNTLQNNYALDTVTPIPSSPDPNGPDGGTITKAQIISTMQTIGWDTASVWNTATVATLGRPTLLQNPE